MEYLATRARFFIALAERQGSWLARCEVCGDRPAAEVHHMRGRLGDLMVDSRYFLGVCRRCHDKITANPALAYEMGWSVPRVESD